MALEDGIVWHVKFENDWTDSAGNLSDGTPNGAGFVEDDPVGQYSAILDGINDRISWTGTDPALDLGTGDFSLYYLVKLNAGEQYAMFYDRYGSTALKRVFFLVYQGSISCKIGIGAWFQPALSVPQDEWVLVGWSVKRDDEANSFLQVNNNFATGSGVTASSALDLDNDSNMLHGCRYDAGDHFMAGRTSQMTQWGRALSQAEGLEYYNSGAFKDLLPAGIVSGRRRRMLN